MRIAGPVPSENLGHGITLREDVPAERASKRRRMFQIGSSPPPFTAASRNLAPNRQLQRDKLMDRVDFASRSPKASRKLKQTKNPLELRSSPPASPPPSEPTADWRHQAFPQAPQLRTNSEAVQVAGDAGRDSLQRKRQLDWNDPSSPIGTFGGQVVRRSDRSLRTSRIESVSLASRNTKTVGLPDLDRGSHLRTRSRDQTHIVQVAKVAGVDHTENAAQGLQKGRALKRVAEEKLVKQKRRRAKIQRVQFETNIPPSSAEQPLINVDYHLNSQPDAHLKAGVFDAADESEISYFPTLPPSRRLSPRKRQGSETTCNQSASAPDRAAEHPISLYGQSSLHSSAPVALGLSGVDSQDGHAEEGDSGVGLLEVLSQSAMRNIDQVQTTVAVPLQQSLQIAPFLGPAMPSPRHTRAQRQVHVDFDPSHFTHAQARHIACLIVKSRSERSGWSSVHPDTVPERRAAFQSSTAKSVRLVQSAGLPPSSHAISRDLGLSSAQTRKTPRTETSDFTHYNPGGVSNNDQVRDENGLAPFEHGLRFAGYRLSCEGSAVEAARNSTEEVQCLQPLRAEALQKLMRLRRKQVVKIIIPFSEPALSPGATRARFIAPQQMLSAPQRQSTVLPDDSRVLLAWMQFTAQNFLHALESMVQAGFARSLQSSSYSINSLPSDLYPCPILHYAAHAETRKHPDPVQAHSAGGDAHQFIENVPSHIALYVHLDRIEEARQSLAALELGNVTDTIRAASYRPFDDPLVRLLVTSLIGEPICLI